MGEPDAQVIRLSSLRLPETDGLRRDMPARPDKRTKGYAESFDAHTLIYDCFYDDQARQVVLVCPRLLNLWPVLRDGLMLNGQPVGRILKRRKHLRVEILRIPASRHPETLELRVAHESLQIPVLSRDLGTFRGRNVLMAISRNNPLEWIEDWARYHVSAHAADALLLVDNGSTEYTPGEVQKRLSAVPGIKVCRVVSAPFPYGGRSGGRLNVPAKFLQTSMFNLAKLRFLHRARAVLSVDIDELVWPQNGSIFDAAVGSRLGMVAFFGHWVYPTQAGVAQPQRAHSMRKGRKMIPNPKWCLVPDSPAGRFSWAIHRPAGLFYPLSIRKGFGFWHCFATSTSWKGNRTKKMPGLVPCPELTAALREHLPVAR